MKRMPDAKTELNRITGFMLEPWLRLLVLARKVFFSNWICTTNNETDADTGTAQALFNGQRTEKWEPSLQIFNSIQPETSKI